MTVSSGTYSDVANVVGVAAGYSVAATTTLQYLLELQLPFAARIGGIQATAAVVATGAGSTVLDVRINGTSIWTASGSRPTLATASTGSFTVVQPQARTLKRGDLLSLLVVSIPASTGHARVALTVTLDR